ncbi:hypothetical protein [Caballeronia sp. Lep1P3]|uniref:hypothetical protein n=1 Tax=Caballeronia sp. Lep1P3 TaxID=2878150 RepID=UPI001FD31C8A|nr:hypothetical protein [Caballeronia sp. Lep1P3]
MTEAASIKRKDLAIVGRVSRIQSLLPTVALRYICLRTTDTRSPAAGAESVPETARALVYH